MTPIYKTAYPYYSEKKKIADAILFNDYRLTRDELSIIKQYFPKSPDTQLCYAVLLVVFRQLNYFPTLTTIPDTIITYLKDQLCLPVATFHTPPPSTLARYRKRIYRYYAFRDWNSSKKTAQGKLIYPVRDFAKATAIQSSQLHNYPADIINVVVEQFKKKQFELPTFKQLDRLVRHARATVNQSLFDEIYRSLTNSQITALNGLLETTEDYQRSDYHALKFLPKKPTISHFRELLKHYDWLGSFGDLRHHLKPIIPIKLKQFSEQARTLDASDLKDFSPTRPTVYVAPVSGQDPAPIMRNIKLI